MATVDLGKIKFHWRGAFSNSNTYEADDVVSPVSYTHLTLPTKG